MSGLLCIVLGYFALGFHMLTCLCEQECISHLSFPFCNPLAAPSPSESRMDFSPYTA